MARRNSYALIAAAAFTLAAGFVVADGFLDAPSRGEPRPAGEIDGAAGIPLGPDSDERADHASGLDLRPTRPRERDRSQRQERELARRVAAGILGGTKERRDRQRCAGSCTGQIRQQVLGLRVRERVTDFLTVRSCTSSIGGRATCFAFGGGAYLLGDAPRDGHGELGFCGRSGYYYVSGPPLAGGSGAACPGNQEPGQDIAGGAPVAYGCRSSTGGEATCFYFADGSYFVSDPFDDGEGELGFCAASSEERARSRYHYVSAPSLRGRADGDCPDAPRGRATPRPSA